MDYLATRYAIFSAIIGSKIKVDFDQKVRFNPDPLLHEAHLIYLDEMSLHFDLFIGKVIEE